MRTQYALATSIVTVTLMHEGLLAFSQDKKETLMRVALEGWLNNEQSFSRAVQCKFQVTDGLVKDKQAALERKFVPTLQATVRWTLRNGAEVWAIEGVDKLPRPDQAEQQLVKGAEKKAYSSGISSQSFLNNGRQQLRYVNRMRLVNLFTPENPEFEGHFLFPGLEGVGPGRQDRSFPRLLLAQADKGTLTFETGKKVNSKEVITITCNDRDQNSTYEYSLDPERGFFPLRSVDHRPTFTMEKLTLELQSCSNGRYFPRRSIMLQAGGTLDGKMWVREFRVTELNVDDRPPDSALTVHLPEGIKVVDRRDPKTTYTLEAPLEVGLNDIETLLRRGADAAAVAVRMEGISVEQAGPSMRWMTLIVALCVSGIVVVAVLLWWRHKRALGTQTLSGDGPQS